MEPPNKTTRALALLEDAAGAGGGGGGGPWQVYIGAQWHPDCLNAQQRATALRARADAEADTGADGAPRRRLVYVSNDVDDEAVDRVKVRSQVHVRRCCVLEPPGDFPGQQHISSHIPQFQPPPYRRPSFPTAKACCGTRRQRG